MRNRNARLAGLLYAVAAVFGWFDLMYLPSHFITPGDAVATAHAILANEFLFRIAIVSDLLAGVIWLSVVLALYQLLADVDRLQAGLMIILGAFMQVPLYFVNALNYVAALLVLTNAAYTSSFSSVQREALAMLFLRLHHYELEASFVFAGLWLIPFGILVFKSRFLPRILGVWLVADAFAWLAISTTSFLAPQYSDTVWTIVQPLTFAEIAITLWLLVMGTGRLFRAKQSAASRDRSHHSSMQEQPECSTSSKSHWLLP